MKNNSKTIENILQLKIFKDKNFEVCLQSIINKFCLFFKFDICRSLSKLIFSLSFKITSFVFTEVMRKMFHFSCLLINQVIKAIFISE